MKIYKTNPDKPIEMSMLEVYKTWINEGKTKAEAIDFVIDCFTGGMSSGWESDTWDKARQIVADNLSI